MQLLTAFAAITAAAALLRIQAKARGLCMPTQLAVVRTAAAIAVRFCVQTMARGLGMPKHIATACAAVRIGVQRDAPELGREGTTALRAPRGRDCPAPLHSRCDTSSYGCPCRIRPFCSTSSSRCPWCCRTGRFCGGSCCFWSCCC